MALEDIDLWKFLLAAGTTIVGGAWAAFVYFDQRGKSKAKSPAQAISVSQLPRGAVAITLAGIALGGWAVVTGMGDRSRTSIDGQSITVTNGVGAGGDIEDSTINVIGGD